MLPKSWTPCCSGAARTRFQFGKTKKSPLAIAIIYSSKKCRTPPGGIVTFGMHVHVGVDSGDKAVMLIDRMNRYIPTLLALSVNSPFWVSRDTGLHSQRSKIMEQLPNAGLPPLMRNFSEYCWVVRAFHQYRFINSIRIFGGTVRPHPGFGTVEVRICDLPCCLDDALSLAALIQCLVCRLSDDIDKGVYQHDIHPIMVKQNKWKACRYGLDAKLVDSVTHKPIPASISNANGLRPA